MAGVGSGAGQVPAWNWCASASSGPLTRPRSSSRSGAKEVSRELSQELGIKLPLFLAFVFELKLVFSASSSGGSAVAEAFCTSAACPRGPCPPAVGAGCNTGAHARASAAAGSSPDPGIASNSAVSVGADSSSRRALPQFPPL